MPGSVSSELSLSGVSDELDRMHDSGSSTETADNGTAFASGNGGETAYPNGIIALADPLAPGRPTLKPLRDAPLPPLGSHDGDSRASDDVNGSPLRPAPIVDPADGAGSARQPGSKNKSKNKKKKRRRSSAQPPSGTGGSAAAKPDPIADPVKGDGPAHHPHDAADDDDARFASLPADAELRATDARSVLFGLCTLLSLGLAIYGLLMIPDLTETIGVSQTVTYVVIIASGVTHFVAAVAALYSIMAMNRGSFEKRSTALDSASRYALTGSTGVSVATAVRLGVIFFRCQLGTDQGDREVIQTCYTARTDLLTSTVVQFIGAVIACTFLFGIAYEAKKHAVEYLDAVARAERRKLRQLALKGGRSVPEVHAAAGRAGAAAGAASASVGGGTSSAAGHSSAGAGRSAVSSATGGTGAGVSSSDMGDESGSRRRRRQFRKPLPDIDGLAAASSPPVSGRNRRRKLRRRRSFAASDVSVVSLSDDSALSDELSKAPPVGPVERRGSFAAVLPGGH